MSDLGDFTHVQQASPTKQINVLEENNGLIIQVFKAEEPPPPPPEPSPYCPGAPTLGCTCLPESREIHHCNIDICPNPYCFPPYYMGCPSSQTKDCISPEGVCTYVFDYEEEDSCICHYKYASDNCA